mmetsp:Transcript_3056/g.3540  ORF Transcript_3056/g.3540 Transcript_3056/m.3540 type:complete len:335 (-) Transcript_3056:204-1208(-)
MSDLYASDQNIRSIFQNAFKIFARHWKIVISITVIQVMSLIVNTLIFILLSLTMFSSMVMDIIDNIPGIILLTDRIFMIGPIASRLLTRNVYYIDVRECLGFFALFSAFSLLAMTVIYIFQGAITHALGVIYAGRTPTLESIKFGWRKKWIILCFHWTLSFAITIILMSIFSIHISLSQESNLGITVIAMLIIYMLATLFFALLVLGIPTIVIEGKSSFESMKYSWSRMKENYILIIGCSFPLKAVLFVALSLLSLFTTILPIYISVPVNLMILLVLITIIPILSFCIYMAVRIPSECLTQEKFSTDFLSPDTSAVPMTIGVKVSDYEKVEEEV